MSSTILNSLGGQRFDGMMDFMRSVQSAGFFDEFDNSLIMRMIWTKLAELEKAIGHRDHRAFFMTAAEANPIYGTVLNVILHSTIKESITAKMVLFLRDHRLTVTSDVLTEDVKPSTSQTEVSASGVYWPEAEKLLKANKHFDDVGRKAFRALYKSLAPRGDDVAVRLLITPMQLGWRVEYRMHGKKILVTQFEFNK